MASQDETIRTVAMSRCLASENIKKLVRLSNTPEVFFANQKYGNIGLVPFPLLFPFHEVTSCGITH
jgi:hypothetical protein